MSFTFGTPFDRNALLAVTDVSGGNASNHLSSNLTLSSGTMTVANNSGVSVGFSSAGSTGAAQATPISAGSNFTGFTPLTNNVGRGSIFSVLEGVASSNRLTNATFIAGQNSATSGILAVSDVVNFSGTFSDKFTLQLSYDPSIDNTTALGIRVLWLDPADGKYKDSYFGNSDGGLVSQMFLGAYVPVGEFQLGNYGVDTVNTLFGQWSITTATSSRDKWCRNLQHGRCSPVEQYYSWLFARSEIAGTLAETIVRRAESG